MQAKVVILNPWDSQGVQIADGTGIYPTVRGCGGGGYQQGYVLQHLHCEEMKKENTVGCDLYNFALTGGVACALNANTGLSANHAGPSVLIEMKQPSSPNEATVFSIGSMNSEGMLSDNPKSGIHETTVARAVCASGSNPTGWQGGDLVVIKKSSDGGVKCAVSILPDSRIRDEDGGTSAK